MVFKVTFNNISVISGGSGTMEQYGYKEMCIYSI